MGDEDKLEKIFGGEGSEDRPTGESQAMIRQQQQSNEMAKYLIATDDKMKLNDLLMRTMFASREEMLLFNDYVAWCEDFGIPLDNAIRYAAARPSVGGVSRNQLVEALTVFKQYDHRRQSDGAGKKEKSIQ